MKYHFIWAIALFIVSCSGIITFAYALSIVYDIQQVWPLGIIALLCLFTLYISLKLINKILEYEAEGDS